MRSDGWRGPVAGGRGGGRGHGARGGEGGAWLGGGGGPVWARMAGWLSEAWTARPAEIG